MKPLLLPAMPTPGGFKAYDVRATVPDQLNEDIAYRIGLAYANWGGVTARGGGARYSSYFAGIGAGAHARPCRGGCRGGGYR